MANDKPPYSLTFKFKTARPDALGEALAQLRETSGEYDLTGESSATLTIESWREVPLTSIREDFEVWLHHHRIGLECEVVSKGPGLRPETITALRATEATPMDKEGWESPEESEPTEHEGEVLVTPDSFQRLALPEPGVALMLETSNGEFSVEGDGDDAA